MDFYYNAFGQRVLNVGRDGQKYYIYNEDGQPTGEYSGGNSQSVETVYLDGMPIAVLTTQGYFYILVDQVNTPVALVQPDGMTVWDWRNRDPFGNNIPVTSSTVPEYDHRFPGQVADKETGLYYNYFRDYDPQTGRYVQSDPIGLAGGVNTYAYVSANPLSLTDSNGLQAGAAGTAFEAAAAAAAGYSPASAANQNAFALDGDRSRGRGDPAAARQRDSSAGLRQSEYVRAKNFCDKPPPSGSNDCSTLSKQIDHAEQCISMYESWDNKWLPGRHDEKLAGWRNRLQNLKNTHNAKCTQKCQ